jgi:hypothetical protein
MLELGTDGSARLILVLSSYFISLLTFQVALPLGNNVHSFVMLLCRDQGRSKHSPLLDDQEDQGSSLGVL